MITWKTSSHSYENGNCIEVGTAATVRLVRDTKDRDGGTLTFAPDTWGALLGAVKAGQFDLS